MSNADFLPSFPLPFSQVARAISLPLRTDGTNGVWWRREGWVNNAEQRTRLEGSFGQRRASIATGMKGAITT